MNLQLETPISKKQNNQVNVVVFLLDGQQYALPIELVHQIIEIVTLTRIPRSAEQLAGVINFHGVIVPIFYLRSYVGLPKLDLQLHTPIILVNHGDCLIGLIVDQVLDVFSFITDEITALQTILPEGFDEAHFLRGLIQAKGSTILLLDLGQLLKSPQVTAILEIAKEVEKGLALTEEVKASTGLLPEDSENVKPTAASEPISEEQPIISKKIRAAHPKKASSKTNSKSKVTP